MHTLVKRAFISVAILVKFTFNQFITMLSGGHEAEQAPMANFKIEASQCANADFMLLTTYVKKDIGYV